jgi:hypothetical protein
MITGNTTSTRNLERDSQLPRNPTNGNSADQIELSSDGESEAEGSSRLGGLLGGLQENFTAESATVRAGGNLARESRDARAVYRRHGDVEHSLSERQDIGRLISRSPQVDNASGTHNDEIRCGGAALLNAMLLDGGYEANARAIRSLAEPAPGSEGRLSAQTADGRQPFHMTDEQRSALDAMQAGHMTPNQASQIQEMLFQMSDGVSDGSAARESGNDGLDRAQMQDMVSRLSRAGAFPNSRELNMRMDENGAGGYHWTTTVTTAHGTQHANSWPSNEHRGFDGYARVRSVSPEDRSDYIYTGGERGTFTDDVTLRRPNPIASARVSGRSLVDFADGSEAIRAF